eukprot:TRINITY_DN31680_c0_g1_i1.p1 TRINITY_DN31680_c0_g1~~TRINITY_DN31680_c0_g1_i1.p1  ORF type:complete len:281 (+),score=61.37 TRINITY_DN31680_c0_g1_i1:64-906(+)
MCIRDSLNDLFCDKYVKFNKYIHELGAALGAKTKKLDKDFHNKTVKVTKLASNIIAGERSLGREVMTPWEQVADVERIRMAIIKKAFETYFAKHIEIFGKSPAMEGPMKMLETFDAAAESLKFCSLDQILQGPEIEILKSICAHGTKVDSVNDLRKALSEFELELFNDQSLIVKKFAGQKDGGLMKSYEDCEFTFTIDDFLLLTLLKKDDPVRSAENKIKIQTIKIKPKSDSQFFWEIIETKPGFLMSSTNKYVLKFKSVEDQKEFKEIVLNKKPNAFES